MKALGFALCVILAAAFLAGVAGAPDRSERAQGASMRQALRRYVTDTPGDLARLQRENDVAREELREECRHVRRGYCRMLDKPE